MTPQRSDVFAQSQDLVCRSCCLRTEADTNDDCDNRDSRTCRTHRIRRQITNLIEYIDLYEVPSGLRAQLMLSSYRLVVTTGSHLPH